MKPELPESTKKPYKSPELSVYGDVREITRTVGDKGGADGGTGSMGKSMA